MSCRQAVLPCIIIAYRSCLCQAAQQTPKQTPGLLCGSCTVLQSFQCMDAPWKPCMLRAGCCCCRSEAGSGGLSSAPGTPDTRLPIRDAATAAGRLAATQGPQLGHHLCHPQGAGHLDLTEPLDVQYRGLCPKAPCMYRSEHCCTRDDIERVSRH